MGGCHEVTGGISPARLRRHFKCKENKEEMKIMFICTGNICRSAMAEEMLENMVKEETKNIEVYSCGIFAEDGGAATDNAIEVMKEYGIDLSEHRATNIRNSNIKDMDIILCATTAHKNNVINMYPDLSDRTYTIKEYAGYPENDLDINDPWGYDLTTYRECAWQIWDCLEKIMEKI
ncbi:MAG: low molecular weight protein arginine phosphatase [Firmicutes bacterium]|nr:low molecular weight protein arginine phosphatase [Bacillota bacterium]